MPGNCHGIACDTFIDFAVSMRWQEVRDFFPDDLEECQAANPRERHVVDWSWLGLRGLENLSAEEWKQYDAIYGEGHCCRGKPDKDGKCKVTEATVKRLRVKAKARKFRGVR